MYILFDIGGTNMRIAATRDEESFGEPIVIPTPKMFEEGMELFAHHAHALAQGDKIDGVVGGIAGTLTQDRGTMIASPNLPGWAGNPLRGKLQDLLSAPVYIENDSAMVGLGEAVYGAGRGYGIVAYITISTGVGGARIINGEIDESANGFEPGHQIVDPDNSMCPECEGNDLESYISGTSITKRYGVKPYEITDPLVWDKLARFLAYGLNNTIAYWSPHVIVLGGSMMKKIGIPIDAVKKHLREIFRIMPDVSKIEKATLGDFGGLWGALAYIKNLKK
ncbi:MAG: ROK family protein [bacterium]|nr:ROK family protein [bacterium]